MKKLMIPLVIVILCMSTMFIMGASPGTMRGWIELRAISATDDTGLAANAAEWDDVSGSVVAINIQEPVGIIQIVFKITNADNEIANWCLYACKGYGSVPEFVAYGTATAGLTETGETTEFFADTITITNQDWYKTISVKDGYQYNLGTGVVTGAGVSALILDSCEYTHWLMLMSKNTCATGGAYITNFN